MPSRLTISKFKEVGTLRLSPNGRGIIADGTRIPVPSEKVKWDEGNPTGHGIIFIGSNGQVLCYVWPGGV
jgi:hypothetical protein